MAATAPPSETAPDLETKSLPANAYQPLKEGELYVPLVPTSMSKSTGPQLITGNFGPVPNGTSFPQVS